MTDLAGFVGTHSSPWGTVAFVKNTETEKANFEQVARQLMRGYYLARRLLSAPLRRRYLYRPEVLLGSPPGGNRWSAISAPKIAYSKDLERLLDFALQVIDAARYLDLSSTLLGRPHSSDARNMNIWPGEHYRLLAAMSHALPGSLLVEVGTYRGAGSLALLSEPSVSVVTYDLTSWKTIPESLLMPSDFGSRFEQRLGDLVDGDFLQSQIATLRQASLVFVDAPKDGTWEYMFADKVLPNLSEGTIVVFDDIRLLNMIELWRNLDFPTLDVTSFGHHTGTGLVMI